MPYSGIFSHSHKKDVISAQIDPKKYPHINGLAKIKSQKLAAERIKKQCNAVSLLQRLDCYPEEGGDKTKCLQRGCCWKEPNQSKRNVEAGTPPSCFYPSGYPSYKMIGEVRETDLGYEVDLRRVSSSPYPVDISQLKVVVYLETDNRVHFKV